MTGFGTADGSALGGRLRIEIRTVNHRYYNPHLKLPFELAGVEAQVRDRLRQLLDRGHVAVTARWLELPLPLGEGAITVDLARAKQVVAALKELKRHLKLKGEPDLAFVARQPDVLTVQANGAGAVAWGELEPIVEQAARAVLAMREREGQALAAELERRLQAIAELARTVESRAPVRLAAEHERLKKAVAELASGVRVDEQRLAMEIALLADRVDITEELVRLRTHLEACRETLGKEGAVGKQLGFLAQEVLREINTIGSKANDAAITQAVIAMKGELEKLREQLENLE
jgi:uncharacterized protein (TIGR00255 family)